jgi:hypothetical protein
MCNFPKCCKVGNVLRGASVEPTAESTGESIAEHESWHEDEDDDVTEITM